MTVGIGEIGSGVMGYIHTRAAQRVPGGALVAVAGGRRAPDLAASRGVQAEPSVEALLARLDVDAVVISTPHATHTGLVLAAAAAGKHVLLEKPMGVTLADCDAMIAACEQVGVTFMLAHVTRFLEASRVARAAIDAGEIGEPRMVTAERLLDTYGHVPAWALDPREGSSFLDWGSHGCDMVRWLMGADPVTASGRAVTFGGPGSNLSVMALYGFPGARMASVWQSYEMAGPGLIEHARYVVAGSAGTLVLRPYGGHLTLDRDGKTTVLYTGPEWVATNKGVDFRDGQTFGAGFDAQMQAFVAAVTAGASRAVTADDGRAAVAMVVAAEEAGRTGQAQAVDIAAAAPQPAGGSAEHA